MIFAIFMYIAVITSSWKSDRPVSLIGVFWKDLARFKEGYTRWATCIFQACLYLNKADGLYSLQKSYKHFSDVSQLRSSKISILL